MSDITVINDSEQSSLVTNGLAKNGELYLKAAGSTDAGAIVAYDSGVWRTFANEYAPSFTQTYSLEFDGGDDEVTVPHHTSLNFSGEHTLSCWVKAPNLSGYGMLITKEGGGTNYRLGLFNDQVYYYNGGTSVFHTSTLSTNTWHHIAASHSNSNDQTVIYIDGVSYSATNTTDSSTTSTADLCIGHLNSGYRKALKIDEVAVFGSVLSASDITAIYNSGVPNDLTSYSPVGWWRMGDNDGGTGTTITDQGSGGNDASLVNGPTFSTDIPS